MVAIEIRANLVFPVRHNSAVKEDKVMILNPEQRPSIPSIRLKALMMTMTIRTVNG